MPDKLMIVMVNTDPSDPAELGAPFFQATVAAAMEYEVEVILTGRAGELAIRGVAELAGILGFESLRDSGHPVGCGPTHQA